MNAFSVRCPPLGKQPGGSSVMPGDTSHRTSEPAETGTHLDQGASAGAQTVDELPESL